VLTTDEAPHHPHNKLRRTYVEIDGIVQPAPRFSRTVPDLPIPPQPPSGLEEAETVLAPWPDPAEIVALRAAGTLGRRRFSEVRTTAAAQARSQCRKSRPHEAAIGAAL